MNAKPKQNQDVIRSFVDELKKIAYIGSAAPYILLGDQSKTILGGVTIIAIAAVWFIICQVVAHFLLWTAVKVEENTDE